MYNAALISVFDEMEVGFVECKNLVVIPLSKKNKSEENIFSLLRLEQKDGFKRLLAVKFVKVKDLKFVPLLNFKILRKTYDIIDESDWYINPLYDALNLRNIDKLADPSILLQNDRRRIKYWLRYYVDLRHKGYSEEDAINTIYS